jgi:uncharacterized coiled-coil protein SlyX
MLREAGMALDERVVALEGRMSEQSQTLEFFREAIGRIEQRFITVDQRFNALEQRMDARFAQVDARFVQVDARFDRLEDNMSRQFLWIVGIQVTTLIAIVASLIEAMGALVTRS